MFRDIFGLFPCFWGAGETASAYLLIYSFLLPLLSGEDKKLAKNRKHKKICEKEKYHIKYFWEMWKRTIALARVSRYPKEKMLTDL